MYLSALGDVFAYRVLLIHLQDGGGEDVRFRLAVPVGPDAIHLIALDADDGHQWTSRTQPNKFAAPKRRSGLVLHCRIRWCRGGKGRRQGHAKRKRYCYCDQGLFCGRQHINLHFCVARLASVVAISKCNGCELAMA
jgi:hypothetical protein